MIVFTISDGTTKVSKAVAYDEGAQPDRKSLGYDGATCCFVKKSGMCKNFQNPIFNVRRLNVTGYIGPVNCYPVGRDLGLSFIVVDCGKIIMKYQ